jgi:hypothetical protein
MTKKTQNLREEKTFWLAYGRGLRSARLALHLSERAAKVFGAYIAHLPQMGNGGERAKHLAQHFGLVAFCQKYHVSADWLIAGSGRRFRGQAA